MRRFGEEDIFFPGSQNTLVNTQSIEMETEPVIHFHNPSFAVYEARKQLARSCIEGAIKNRLDKIDCGDYF